FCLDESHWRLTLLVALTARYRAPEVYNRGKLTAASGLMSYGTGRSDPYRALPNSLSRQEACRPGGAAADEGQADQHSKPPRRWVSPSHSCCSAARMPAHWMAALAQAVIALAAQCRVLPDSRSIAAQRRMRKKKGQELPSHLMRARLTLSQPPLRSATRASARPR